MIRGKPRRRARARLVDCDVFALARSRESDDFDIASAYPERRRTNARHEAFQEIARLSIGLERSTLFSPVGVGPVPEALRKLVNGLVDQLRGRIRLEDESTATGSQGTMARVSFPREEA